jgi:hypothetical protein
VQSAAAPTTRAVEPIGGPLPSAPAERGVLVRAVRRPWVLAVAAAVVALLVVALVALAGGGTDSTKAQTPPAPTSQRSSAAPQPGSSSQGGQPAAPGTGQAQESAGTPGPPASTGPAMPPGWRMYTDPTGFSVAAPDGWAVSHEGTMLYFRDPNAGRILGIDQTNQPNSDPVADWTNQEKQRAGGFYRGYLRLRIEAVRYFVACADWEFTYDQNGARAHVINRGFVTSDHQAYAIWWSTPESSWRDDLKYFELITSTFKPKP